MAVASSKKMIMFGFLIALGVALFLSPWASSFPDGLERVAENLGFIKKAEEPEAVLWKNAPLRDYKIPGIGNESMATGLAGLAGTVIIAAAGWGVASVLKKRKRR